MSPAPPPHQYRRYAVPDRRPAHAACRLRNQPPRAGRQRPAQHRDLLRPSSRASRGLAVTALGGGRRPDPPSQAARRRNMTVIARTSAPIALRTLLRRLIDRLGALPPRFDAAPSPHCPLRGRERESPLVPLQALDESLSRLRDALGLPEKPTSPPRGASTVATGFASCGRPGRRRCRLHRACLLAREARRRHLAQQSTAHSGNGSLASALSSQAWDPGLTAVRVEASGDWCVGRSGAAQLRSYGLEQETRKRGCPRSAGPEAQDHHASAYLTSTGAASRLRQRASPRAGR